MEVPHLCDDPLGMKKSHRPDPKHDVHLTEAAYSSLKQQAGQEKRVGGLLPIRFKVGNRFAILLYRASLVMTASIGSQLSNQIK